MINTINKHSLWRKTGSLWPLGIPISQSWLDIGAVLMAIQELKIKTFVEIGVHRGGLASLVIPRTLFVENFHYVGYEIDPFIIEDTTKAYINSFDNVQVFIEDALVANALVITEHPCLVLCDGGNKPLELQIYSRRLSVGDYIMADDYGKEIKENDCSVEGIILERIKTEWMASTKMILFEIKKYD